jgi:spermidine/putrescine transport system ATP-binding protein
MDSDARNRYVWSFLCKFGLQQVAERKSTQISVGQRQRLSLATALANHPTCILLDEPFSSLDYLRRKQFQIFYREIAKSVTSVFVTHDLSEALHVGDLVRVGLQADAPVLSIDRGDLPYEAWEDSVDFRITRQKLLKILELTSSK